MAGMTKLLSGFVLWFCGACMLFHVAMLVLTTPTTRISSETRRLRGHVANVVIWKNWHISVPGFTLFGLGYHLMVRARLNE